MTSLLNSFRRGFGNYLIFCVQIALLKYDRLHFEVYDFLDGRGGCFDIFLHNKDQTIWPRFVL